MDEQGSEPVEELALEPVAVVRKPRPRALWAVLAAVGVAAGAVVVTSTDDDGNQRAGLPVDLAWAAPMAGSELAADSSMLAAVTYVPGDDLPALGGEATAYRLSGDVDEGQVRRLADALGLDGAVEPGPDGTWSVAGGDDGGQLDVSTGGGAIWRYSSPWDCRPVADDAVTCSGDAAASSGGSTETVICDRDLPPASECTVTTVVDSGPCDAGNGCAHAPTTTVVAGTGERAPDLPSEEEARKIAIDVVAASGANVDGARVTADHGYSWFVTVEPVLDGIPSGQLAYVEVGAGGAVTSGNGWIGQPEALSEYPLVDTRAAIDRANEQGGTYRAIEPALGDPGATGSGSGTTGAAGGTTGAAGGTTGAAGGTDPAVLQPPIADVADTVPGAYRCKVQPDGSEICEMEECASDATTPGDDIVATTVCERTVCPPFAAEPGTASSAAEDKVRCPQPDPGVAPVPEPEPIEVVLVDAERSLMFLPDIDGTGDAYLVPAYRYTAEDGGTVDLPAIADEALTAPNTTDTVPATDPPQPVPVPEPRPCEILEEQYAPGSTHTMQTCPTPDEAPDVGARQVDALVMDDHCTWLVVKLGGKVWWTPDYFKDDLHGWSEPTEAGTFTIHEDGSADFVADADPERVATLVPWDGGTEGPLCQ